MNGPDGIEERTEWQESAYDHATDALDVREQLADELRSTLINIARTDLRAVTVTL